jgi:carbon-monoxide dehydrogenase iron sulfur subunit
MLVPGVEFPHLCAQCDDEPCVKACPVKALSVSRKTSAILVDNKKCTGCGKCINACPGRIPHLHPVNGKIVICDLCSGSPQCVKACQEGGWNTLQTVTRRGHPYKLYARTPEELTRSLATKLYGEKGEEFL